MEYRDYQIEMDQKIDESWIHNQYVMAVLPTGAGKSVVVSKKVKDTEVKGGVCVIAHRQELVSQMSMHLARDGIYHNIISSVPVVKMINKMHMQEYGQSFYRNQAPVAVAGVDTIIRRGDSLKNWLPKVKLWVIDECHHIIYDDEMKNPEKVKDNKWGKAIRMFPKDAKGLGVTATPLRLDGKGLGRHADGCFDDMIVGTDMRTLINRGYLTDYRIFSPPSRNFNREEIKVTASGDFSDTEVNKAINDSSLVAHDGSSIYGDVVESYIKFAKDQLGVVFVPSMEVGYELETEFNNAGITALLVNAKTPDNERALAIKRFSNGEIKVLLNVDLFGEGFDLPAISVVSMVRPTKSYGLYVQMFGRALRLLAGKKFGIIIDHVGNVAGQFGHGLPDAPRWWTLDAQDKRSGGNSALNPIKTCSFCHFSYERYLKVCPECRQVEEPTERTIETVDGDLEELSPEILRELRGEVNSIDRPIDEQVNEYVSNLNPYIKPIHAKRHIKAFRLKVEANIEAQRELRGEMAQWAGYVRADGHADHEIFKKWYVKYGVDWLTAQSLEATEADKLKEKIDYGQY